jgi:nucleoid DNA-binding protein
MDELVRQLSQKAGVTQDKAEQIGQFLKEHAADVPGWVSQQEPKLVALMTEKVGVTKEQAEKVVQTIKAQAGDWMKNLGGQAPGMAQKAKDAVAGLFGKK